MYAPRFQLRAFETIPEGAKLGVLVALLEGLIAADVAYLLAHPGAPTIYLSGVTYRGVPQLYESGVRYQEEARGKEDWLDIPEIISRGVADCEDLACWRIAELRVRERERATPAIKRTQLDRTTVYHIAVRRQNGRLEDPSRVLGMGRR